ncbi:MAG: hypothetical protein ABWY36_06235 [Leifsonia sp.]
MRISVFNSKELQATILALRGFDRTMQAQVRRVTKEVAAPAWKEATRAEASSRLEVRTLSDTARVAVSNQNVTLKSAAVGRQLSKTGKAKPSDIYAGVEFGADRRERAVAARSRKGTSYSYKRNTTAQFKPRNRKGYVVYPAAANVIPRLASAWTQTVVRTFHEALEGRRG